MLQQTALFWVLLESGEHVVGQWCDWIMMRMGASAWDVRLDGAEFEVQCTIKRAELTAFLCFPYKK